MSDETFYLYRLFLKEPKVTVTDEEIGKIYGISKERVQEYLDADIKGGMIFADRENTTYYLSVVGFDRLLSLKRESF